MQNIIPNLIQFISNSIKYLLDFFVIIFLGIVGALLYAIPWLLRITFFLLWLCGSYLGIASVHIIYASFSPAVPLIALQLAVLLISIAWMTILLRENTKFFWGGMAICGLVVGGISIGSVWLLHHWIYADLFFRALPPALFSVLLIYETIRLRSLFRKGKITIKADTKIIDGEKNIVVQ